MSWHPNEPNRRLWTIYWDERGETEQSGPSDVLQFELTEPYALYRDEWRDLQIKVLTRLMPPDYFLNISQLWSRLWPKDNALLFSKLKDVHNVPLLLTGELDRVEQPGKRIPFYWVMTQLELDLKKLDDLVFFQNIDLENITWITETPIAPFPDQLFEYNKAAFAWNRNGLSTGDFDQIVRRECWGVSLTHLGHLYFLTTRQRRSPEEVFQVLQAEAEGYNLEVETTPYARRPHKPGFLKSLAALPGNILKKE